MKFLAFLFVGLMLALSTSAQLPENVALELDQVFARWREPAQPGLAVAVVREGHTLYSKAFGGADLECGTALETSTRFDCGSLAKAFTAFVVLQLEAQGKLSLDDPLRNHLPELGEACAPIRLRHILEHTSGLRDWGGLVQLSGGRMDDRITTRNVLELVRRQRELEFAPGSEYAYRNVGYVLLAEVVARVSKRSFREVTRETIFEPLGMASATIRDDPTEPLERVATSYERTKRGFRRVHDAAALPGPGSLVLSVDDFARWLAAVEVRALGSPAVWERVFELGRLADGRTTRYAAGWIAAEHDGRAVWTHSGGWAGFRADVVYAPDEALAVVVLANRDDLDPSALARRVFSRCSTVGRVARPAPVDFELSEAELERCVGRFWLEGERTLTITAKEGRLIARASGDWPITLHAESADTFAYRVVDASVRFRFDGAGPATGLWFLRGAYAQPAERLGDDDGSPRDPQELAPFCGRFVSDELGVVYTVEQGPDGLRIPFVRRDALELVPLARDAFAGRGSSVKLRFVRDARGVPVELRVSLVDAHDVRFTRIP